MRRSIHVLFFASLLFGAAGAQAASRAFTGTLAIQIAALPTIVVLGAGVAVVNGSTGGGHLTALALPSGAFSTFTQRVPVTDPGAAPIRELQLTASNGAAGFSGSGGSGSFGGVMALAGAAKVCLAGACSVAVNNLFIPLAAVGSGGAALVSAAVNLTVVGAPWTTGTASIGTVTAMGGVSPLSATDAISLVTPVFVSTNIAFSSVIPVFGFLSLSGLSVPEPGTLVLLGSGVVALVAVGRSRARS